MRTKALYLASCMPDVVKPEQTNDVTPGMSTSMDVSDRKAVTCLSDICHEPLEWLQLPLSKEAQLVGRLSTRIVHFVKKA